jgi:hypothetical protein
MRQSPVTKIRDPEKTKRKSKQKNLTDPKIQEKPKKKIQRKTNPKSKENQDPGIIRKTKRIQIIQRKPRL